jgi:hypothetical protein
MKLSALTIILIGVAVAIIAVSYGLFQAYMPNTNEAAAWRANTEELKTQAGKQGAAEKRVAKAKKMVEDKAKAWEAIVAIHTPTPSVATGGINIGVQGWQLTVDSRKFRNNIQRALNAQIRKGGVKVITAPKIPDPDETASTILANYYNYPAIPFPVVIFDLGTVTVRGTYEQIMANVRSYSTMPRYLAVVDGLRLDGSGTILTASYNLSMVGYIRGTKIYPPVPEGAASASNAGGGAPSSLPGPGGPRVGGSGGPSAAGLSGAG